MLVASSHHRQPFVPSAVMREMTPLVEGHWLLKFLRNADLCLTASILGNKSFFGPESNLRSARKEVKGQEWVKGVDG